MSFYQLYDVNNMEINLGDVESRTEWYIHGETEEESFCRQFGQKLSVAINPAKKTDPTSPDLIWDSKLADLKCQTTPLFVSRTRYKQDPTYTVTFNLKDALEYGPLGSNYQPFYIYYWVKWIAIRMTMRNQNYIVQPISGVWRMDFAKLDIERHAKQIHWYLRRGRGFVRESKHALTLKTFEPRLAEGGRVYDIRGYRGNAACSYVLDLRDMERLA